MFTRGLAMAILAGFCVSTVGTVTARHHNTHMKHSRKNVRNNKKQQPQRHKRLLKRNQGRM